jgi:hypothetical protein
MHGTQLYTAQTYIVLLSAPCPDAIIGWAQRALPIAVDTRPVRNRGYTGPIKSRFDAVTNAHPARKLVNTLSHLSRFFVLGVIHT